MDAARVDAVLDRVLLTVEKPGRYTGGEHNQVVNNWEAASMRVVLAFPDIYELGMSNLGLATPYDILNRRAGILCERTYCPWSDMEAVMRREGLPLFHSKPITRSTSLTLSASACLTSSCTATC